MDSLLREQENYEIRWRKKTVENLEEHRLRGDRYIELPVEEMQQLLLQNIGLLQRLNYVEQELLNFARWNFQIAPIIKETNA